MFTYSVKVDIGVSEKQNDDRALVGAHILADGIFSETVDRDFIIASICDGVGGMAQGYRAAMISLDVLSYLNRTGVEMHTIRTAIEEANRRVRATQITDNLQNGMRSTVAGVYIDDDKFYVFNAGDSRVYRFRHKYFMQLSKDHSLVQDLIDLGEITTQEAREHSQKNIINKCVGNGETVNARIVDLTGDLNEEDIILICSDGISDVVTDDELRDIILEHKLADAIENIRALASAKSDWIQLIAYTTSIYLFAKNQDVVKFRGCSTLEELAIHIVEIKDNFYDNLRMIVYSEYFYGFLFATGYGENARHMVKNVVDNQFQDIEMLFDLLITQVKDQRILLKTTECYRDRGPYSYLKWWKNNLNLYEFNGKEANDIKKEILEYQITGNTIAELREKYNGLAKIAARFRSMFVDNIFLAEMGLTQGKEKNGIISKRMEAYWHYNFLNIDVPFGFKKAEGIAEV